MRKLRFIFVTIATIAISAGVYAFRPADLDAWQADYLELRDILANSYANLAYASGTGLPLRSLDSITRQRLSRARTARGARGALAGFVTAFDDPHLKLVSDAPRIIRYLSNSQTASKIGGAAADACAAMGYREGIGGGYSLPFEDLPGFRPGTMEPNTFSTGSAPGADEKRIGILRISLFSPHKARAHCVRAWTERLVRTQAPCDGACQDSIYHRTGALLATTLRESVVDLEREGVASIVIDIGGNGGGSEWAVLAVRAITNSALQIPPTLVTNIASRKSCRWEEAIERRCSNLSPAKTDSEMVAIFGDERASMLGLPLFVLVDEHTASASEYFAAVLQDSRAARIIGTRTMRAGCGYVDGGGEYTLPRTKLRLRVPNCVRLRRDGSNERAGVRPDIAMRVNLSGVDRAQQVLAAASQLKP